MRPISAALLLLAAARARGEGRVARPEADLYALLGVEPDASSAQIRRAYRERAGALHPDKCAGGAAACARADEQMAALNDAYETLSSPERREHYDLYGGDEEEARTRPPSEAYAASDVRNLAALDATNALDGSTAALWLVAFYMAGCGPCHELVPEYKAAASKLAGVARLGALDCGEHQGACAGARRFPEVVAYAHDPRLGRRVRHAYEGRLEAKALVEWAVSLLPREGLPAIDGAALARGAAAALAAAVRRGGGGGGGARLVLFSEAEARVEPDEARIAAALLEGTGIGVASLECEPADASGARHGACGSLGVVYAPCARLYTAAAHEGEEEEEEEEYDGRLLGARLAEWAAARVEPAGVVRVGTPDALVAALGRARASGRAALLLGGGGAPLELHRLAARVAADEAALAEAGGACADAGGAAACAKWAAAGECARNPAYMRASCARACALCGARAPALLAAQRGAGLCADAAAAARAHGALRALGLEGAHWGALCGAAPGAVPGVLLGVPPAAEGAAPWRWVGAGGGGADAGADADADAPAPRRPAQRSARLAAEALRGWAHAAWRALDAPPAAALRAPASAAALRALAAEAAAERGGGAPPLVAVLTRGGACARCADAEGAALGAAGGRDARVALVQCDADAALWRACAELLADAEPAAAGGGGSFPHALLLRAPAAARREAGAPHEAGALGAWARAAANSTVVRVRGGRAAWAAAFPPAERRAVFALYTGGSGWCPPCGAVAEPWAAASAALGAAGVGVATVDCDAPEDAALCAAHGADGGVPHFALHVDGRVHEYEAYTLGGYGALAQDALLAFATAGGWRPPRVVPLGAHDLFERHVRPQTRGACADYAPLACLARGAAPCADEPRRALAECARTCGVCASGRPTGWVVAFTALGGWCGPCAALHAAMGGASKLARAELGEARADGLQWGAVECQDASGQPGGAAACRLLGLRVIPSLRYVPPGARADDVLLDRSLEFEWRGSAPPSADALARWALRMHAEHGGGGAPPGLPPPAREPAAAAAAAAEGSAEPPPSEPVAPPSEPPRSEPPRSEPPSEPPRSKPPPSEPPRGKPPSSEPPRGKPPSSEPAAAGAAPTSVAALRAMPSGKLRALLLSAGGSCDGCVEKEAYVRAAAAVLGIADEQGAGGGGGRGKKKKDEL